MLVDLTCRTGLAEFGNSKFGFHGSNNIPHVIAPNYVATRELVSTGICTVGPLLRVHGEPIGRMC